MIQSFSKSSITPAIKHEKERREGREGRKGRGKKEMEEEEEEWWKERKTGKKKGVNLLQFNL